MKPRLGVASTQEGLRKPCYKAALLKVYGVVTLCYPNAFDFLKAWCCRRDRPRSLVRALGKESELPSESRGGRHQGGFKQKDGGLRFLLSKSCTWKTDQKTLAIVA